MAIVGERVSKEVSMIKCGHMGGPSSNTTGVLIIRGNLDVQRQVQRVKIQKEDGHL